jgi:hypothetical protein
MKIAYHKNWDDMPNVFISYSADAKKLAERLAASLQEDGVATCSAFEKANPGERLHHQIGPQPDARLAGGPGRLVVYDTKDLNLMLVNICLANHRGTALGSTLT